MVDGIANTVQTQPRPEQVDLPLIKEKDIRAILYLGLLGEVTLPMDKDKHAVDILA